MPFVPPLEVLNAGSTDTRWGNLGDWSRADRYPQAAEALAVRLGEAARLGPGHHVLDAGTGAGEQIRVWVDRFGVTRISAIEVDPELAQAARSRAEREAWRCDIDVRTGKAEEVGAPSNSVDRVVSLDAAYFFRTRARFLENAQRLLKPGGRLALTDLVLGSGPAASLARAMAPIFHIPWSNLWTRALWVASLESAGFREVEIVDCTDAVLGGFARWSRSSRGAPRRSRAIRVVGRVGGALAGAGALGYAVVTAVKPTASTPTWTDALREAGGS